MRKRNFGLAVLAAATALTLAGGASAHHSAAMYDLATKTTLVGTIKEFEWANPHTWVQLEVRSPGDKQSTVWIFESLGTNQLTRAGWKRDSLKAGEAVEVVFNPLRDGNHGGRVVSVLVDGKPIGIQQ
jgi:hypothetical protein